MQIKLIRLSKILILVVIGQFYPLTLSANPIVNVTKIELTPGLNQSRDVSGVYLWNEPVLGDPNYDAFNEEIPECRFNSCLIGICPISPDTLGCNGAWMRSTSSGQTRAVVEVGGSGRLITMADLRRGWIRAYNGNGWNFTMLNQQLAESKCVSLVYGPRRNAILKVVPGSTCGLMPPVGIACDVTSGDLNISHGVIDINKINSQPVAKAAINIQCEGGPATLKFINTSGMEFIVLGIGLKSQLTINNTALTGEGVQVNSNTGNNVVTLESKLIADGKKIEAGIYSGSTTILMEYQ